MNLQPKQLPAKSSPSRATFFATGTAFLPSTLVIVSMLLRLLSIGSTTGGAVAFLSSSLPPTTFAATKPSTRIMFSNPGFKRNHASTSFVVDPTFALKLSHNEEFPQSATTVATTATIASTSATSSVNSVSSDQSAAFEVGDNTIKDDVTVDLPRLNGKSLRQELNLAPVSLFPSGTTTTTTSLSNHRLTRPWVVGHRGCVFQEFENTREGFLKCAQMGVDAAELDVFVLKCGTVIVFHGGGTDEDPGQLLDYCGVEGYILDYTYQQACEQLRFNPNYAEFPCPPERTLQGHIPTLEDVLLDAKTTGLHLKIELKGEGTVGPTLEVVERLNMQSQCSYSTFNLERLALLRQLRPDKSRYPSGALFNDLPEDYLERARAAGATEIHLRYDVCAPNIIEDIHQAGFGSMAWFRGPIGMAKDCELKYWDVGNEDESMYQALLETGVQQLCVNKPDVMARLCRNLHHPEIITTTANADDILEVLSHSTTTSSTSTSATNSTTAADPFFFTPPSSPHRLPN